VEDDAVKVTIDLEMVAAQPGHWPCRLRRHRTAAWIEAEQGTTPLADGSTWVPVAFCTTCDRDQNRLRLVLPERGRHPDAVVLS
jgi:hypothetical protein